MLLLATLFAVAFAVFAMHALTSHERAHSAHWASAVPLAAGAPAADHMHVDATEPGQRENPDDPAHDGGAGELCVTLLTLVTLLITLALRHGVPRGPLFAVPRRTVRPLNLFGRSPDPPCLHGLSILRC